LVVQQNHYVYKPLQTGVVRILALSLFRVGKSIRYRKEDLDAFIESSRTARA
jgi:hypothetical protein